MRPIFFIHVRRTAGATVRAAFDQVVPPELVFTPKGNCQMTDELWGRARLYPYINGHFWVSQWLKYDLPHRFMIILREPVEHQVAVWHNMRHRMENGQDVGLIVAMAVKMGLEDSIESGAIQVLFDRSLDHMASDRKKNQLESAKESLKEAVVGFFDDVEGFVRRALAYADLPVPPVIESKHQNALVDPLDPHLHARLTSYLEPDCELYAWAKKTLC